MKISHYDIWLTKLRKRSAPSGVVSQWAILLSKKQGGDPAIWVEHLRAILDEEEKASAELILDLDLISAVPRAPGVGDEQMPLW